MLFKECGSFQSKALFIEYIQTFEEFRTATGEVIGQILASAVVLTWHADAIVYIYLALTSWIFKLILFVLKLKVHVNSIVLVQISILETFNNEFGCIRMDSHVPVNPVAQVQVKLVRWLLHCPPFKHGDPSQWSKRDSQYKPKCTNVFPSQVLFLLLVDKNVMSLSHTSRS